MKYLALSLLLFTTQAKAQAYTWSLEDRLALIQCLVSETPWNSVTEQAAVSHVLIKRWQQVRAKTPDYPFHKMAKAYCNIFKVRHPNERQRWIKALPFGEIYVVPPGVRDPAKFASEYMDLLNFVRLLENGNIKDPTPEALHWGNLEDHRGRVRLGVLGRVRRIRGVVEDITCPGRAVILVNYYYAVIDANAKKKVRGARQV